MNLRKRTRGAPDNASLYIGDLPTSVTKQDLLKEFGKIGDVKEIKIPTKAGQHLGYAYVNYSKPEDVCHSLISIFQYLSYT